MNKDLFRQISIVIILFVTIAVNILSNALPFNGVTAPEISASFEVYFVPAGYVFSIWGIIYLGLVAYAIYQLLPAQRENPRLRQIGWWFVLSSAANCIWLVLWHYGYNTLSVLAMLTILTSLIMIYLSLGAERQGIPPLERWLVHLTFSIYLGWISVATVANITGTLYSLNWGGFGISPEIWTYIMLAVTTVLAGLMAYFRQDIAYILVLVWAFAGIGVEQANTPQIANAAYLSAGLAALFVIIVFVQKLRQPRTAP
jgi:benzodiazapine receptor